MSLGNQLKDIQTHLLALFESFAFSDVGRNAIHCIDISLLIVEWESDRDIMMQAVIMPDLFIMFERDSIFKDFFIICFEGIRHLFRKKVIYTFVNNIVSCQMKQFFKAFVDQYKLAVAVSDIDDSCGIVQDRLQACFAKSDFYSEAHRVPVTGDG